MDMGRIHCSRETLRWAIKSRVADKGHKISWKTIDHWRYNNGIVGQQGVVWTRITKDRRSWMTTWQRATSCSGRTQPSSSTSRTELEQNRLILVWVTMVYATILYEFFMRSNFKFNWSKLLSKQIRLKQQQQQNNPSPYPTRIGVCVCVCVYVGERCGGGGGGGRLTNRIQHSHYSWYKKTKSTLLLTCTPSSRTLTDKPREKLIYLLGTRVQRSR